MRVKRPNFPKAKYIYTTLDLLQKINVHPINSGWRYSDKGTPNYRFSGETNKVAWNIDIYAGNWFVVDIKGLLPERINGNKAMVEYLFKFLGISFNGDI